MTRDEFMKEAEKEIDQVLLTHRNRLMNLVMKAWSEGKKNAEIDAMTKMAREMLASNGGSGNCNCILGSPKVTC